LYGFVSPAKVCTLYLESNEKYPFSVTPVTPVTPETPVKPMTPHLFPLEASFFA